jgi:predicted MFS family arabinose efflux permease
MQIIRTWLPVVTSMLCMGLGVGLIGVYGFFVEPLSKEFGVGVAVLNIGPVALLLVPGILGAAIGKMADRLPSRRILLVGVSLAMLSLLAISQAPTLLWAALGFLSFSVGLTLYGPVVINGLMVKLYPGLEARALALAAIGISLAAIGLPLLVGNLLAQLDWRGTLLSLAAGVLAVLWLAILAGIPPGVAGTATTARGPTESTFLRNPAFWLIGLCVALALNVAVVLGVSYPPYFASQGYTVADAGKFLAVSGLSGLVGKSVLAWLGDAMRIYAKWLAAALMLLQIAGIGLLFIANDAAGVVPAMCLLGFGMGATMPLHPYLNSRYFDASIISQVTGAQAPLFLPFGMLGAPLAGYAFDQTGNYDLVFIALAAILGAAALFAINLPATLPAKVRQPM